jgi:hypothetical protein
MYNNRERFQKIVKGKIRQNLKKYISRGELIGQIGKNKVSIPVPQIDTPRFRFGNQQVGGVGQGDGNIGDPLGPGQSSGEAGEAPGEHAIEVDVSIDELATMLGEELELPNIAPKGNKNIEQTGKKYNTINNQGPTGLRHVKRTYKENLKRQIITGTYDPNNPVVLPHKNDFRYKAASPISEPTANAVIIYMMDVSGSMGDEQKEIVRIESFWIDTWLNKHYNGLEARFIIHDSEAKEVDRDTFFTTKESGGTKVSSAYKLCKNIIDRDYPPEDWNIYLFHFSDGDNWHGDTEDCIEIMNNYLIPWSNQFGYGQVESKYGSGKLMEDFKEAFENNNKVVLSDIEDRDAIIGSIKEFLGRGN